MMPRMPPAPDPRKVLIVSGGFVSVKDRSPWVALRKQVASFRASSAPWYDLHLKLLNAEHLLAVRRHRGSDAFRRAPYHDVAVRYFSQQALFEPPELAEVLLATLLVREGLEPRLATVSQVFEDQARSQALLAECGTVFLSSTLLRDTSELVPVVARLKRPGNRVVVGGALASLIARDFNGLEGVSVLAAGHGERLVPALAAWLKGGCRALVAPEGGQVHDKSGTLLLFSGPPPGRSLDGLPAPDWALAERLHGRPFPAIHYESARGCPFRCGFCSYPLLFDDRVYRTRSAARMAEEWAAHARRGVRFISCLDSLFTTPRQRLEELCRRLVELGTPVKWLCYARGDDLTDPATCQLMARAGCVQVQLGAESGSQAMLDSMDKRARVADNARAILNCREAGVATFVTVILGFPGETAATVRQTWEFLADTRPDFAYATPFMVRVPQVPVLQQESRAHTRLVTFGGSQSAAPYWRHASMSCAEVGHHWRSLHRRLAAERVALDSSLFYGGMPDYVRQRDREALLDFQRDALLGSPALSAAFWPLRAWTARRLVTDVGRRL
jgi:radical SAM superfamily enzyme YgiQ (UPF0313 family)